MCYSVRAKFSFDIRDMVEKNKFVALRSFLRRAWVRYPERLAAKRAARRKYVGENKRQKWEYECNICKNYFMSKNVVVDHIIPCGTFLKDEDYATFIPNLFCDRSNLQVLCVECHKIKTNAERK